MGSTQCSVTTQEGRDGAGVEEACWRGAHEAHMADLVKLHGRNQHNIIKPLPSNLKITYVLYELFLLIRTV